MSSHYNKKSGSSKEYLLKEESHKFQETDKMSKKLEDISKMIKMVYIASLNMKKKKNSRKNKKLCNNIVNPTYIDPTN